MKALKSFDDANGKRVAPGDVLQPGDYEEDVIAHYRRRGMVEATDAEQKRGSTDAEPVEHESAASGPRHKVDPTNPIPGKAAKASKTKVATAPETK